MTRYAYTFALLLAPLAAHAQGLGLPGPQGVAGGGAALGPELEAIAALTPTDGVVIVGDGSTWVAESGATARTSLGALGGALGATDNALVRADGTGGATAQGSSATLSDANVLDLTATGVLALGTTGNDPRLVRGGVDTLYVHDGGGNFGQLVGSNGFWAKLYLGAGGLGDTALSRDAAGRVLAENGSGTAADLRLAGLIFGTADTSGVKLLLNSDILRVREGDNSAYAPVEMDYAALGGNVRLMSAGSGAFWVRNFANSAFGNLTVEAGSSSAAAYRIDGDADTGMFGTANSFVGITVAGTERFRANTNGIDVNGIVGAGAGSVSAVAYRLASDADTGLFGVANTSVSTSIGGTERFRVTTTGAQTHGALAWPAGLGSVVQLRGPTDETFSIASGSGRALSIAADGTLFLYSDVAIDVTGALLNTSPDNVAAVPYSFSSDPNSGFGRVEADAPAIVAGGKRRIVVGNDITLTDASATTLCTIGLAAGQQVSGQILIHVLITDGTDHSAISITAPFVAVDKAGALTSQISTALSGATYAVAHSGSGLGGLTFSILDGTNAIGIQVNCDTLLTGATITASWEMSYYHSAAHTFTIP